MNRPLSFRALASQPNSAQIALYKSLHTSTPSLGTYRYITIIALGMVAAVVIFWLVEARGGGLGWIVGGVIAFAAVVYGIVWSILKGNAIRLAQHVRYDLFATDNNLRYTPAVRLAKDDAHYRGTIFNFGYNRIVEQQFIPFDGEAIEVGNYACVTSIADQSVTVHDYGYLRIKLRQQVTYGILDNKIKDTSIERLGRHYRAQPVDSQSIVLSTQLSDDRFALFATPESDAAMLAMLTPAFMSVVGGDIDFLAAEVIGDELYIYSKKFNFDDTRTWGRITALLDVTKAHSSL